MKRIIISGLLLLFFYSNIFAQDIITKKNGEDIQSKISEITQTEIKYKKYEYPDGPVYTLAKSDALMIRYENGNKDIFNDKPIVVEENDESSMDMAIQGKEDALVNYRGANSGSGWVLATTILFSPIIGIIPAVACASASPADHNLNYKDSKLMKNNEYNKAYVQQAHKTKKSKIWTGFGIGSGVWGVLYLITASQQ